MQLLNKYEYVVLKHRPQFNILTEWLFKSIYTQHADEHIFSIMKSFSDRDFDTAWLSYFKTLDPNNTSLYKNIHLFYHKHITNSDFRKSALLNIKTQPIVLYSTESSMATVYVNKLSALDVSLFKEINLQEISKRYQQIRSLNHNNKE